MHEGPIKQGKICAVIAEHTLDAVRAALAVAPESGADIVELRLDYLRDFDFRNPSTLIPLLEDKRLPIITTCRAIEEGGYQHIDDSVRMNLLVEAARGPADYCDIEASHYPAAAALSPDLSKLIVSYHDFSSTPSDMGPIYDRLSNLPSAVFKIVTTASSIQDTLPIFALLRRAKLDGKSLIAIAMGQPGAITRILGPALGGWLTYGTLPEHSGSAPGQFTCEQLARSFRINSLSEGTAIAGVIGNPVGHSISPDIHNAALGAMKINAVYVPIEVTNLEDFFARFVMIATREVDWPWLGLSVTIPHKLAVMPLLNGMDETARVVGAVNTITIREGRLWGHNTDVQGAIEPLETLCHLKGQGVAVIGAGGAARAVLYGLAKKGAKAAIYARNLQKAHGLCKDFEAPACPIDELSASNATIIINTTPVGMQGHSEDRSPIPMEAMRGRKIAYDLVYNPLETRFLKEAREAGCKTMGGLEMLLTQAALQFELWTGRKPPLDVMRQAALSKLSKARCRP